MKGRIYIKPRIIWLRQIEWDVMLQLLLTPSGIKAVALVPYEDVDLIQADDAVIDLDTLGEILPMTYEARLSHLNIS